VARWLIALCDQLAEMKMAPLPVMLLVICAGFSMPGRAGRFQTDA
jgi:hypothetical protein